MQPDLLQQMKDLHLPPSPGWWPPAPGWWLVALLVAAAMVWLAVVLRRRAARKRPYRVARRELRRLAAAHAAGILSGTELAHATNAVVKRALIARSGRPEIARLSGEPWQRYLAGLVPASRLAPAAFAAFGAERFAPRARIDAADVTRSAGVIVAHLERAA